MAQTFALLQLFVGKITPYQWHQWYASYVPNYDGQLKSYFQASQEYVNGTAGLYHQWQQLYSDAAFPDGPGVDCGKLDQLQADFWSKHTDAEMTALKAYQAQQESAYPALAMYREVMDNHRANQRHWARQLGMNYTILTQMLRDYGALAGDRRAQAQFPGATPAANDIAAPEQRVGGNSAYGRYYSLLFHTSAMRKGLAAAGETEAQGAHALEAMYHPAAAP